LSKHGHGGITWGSETAGVIKNVYVHDCVFNGTRAGLRFKTRRNRGGGADGVWAERLRMIDVGNVFTWDLLGNAFYMGELAARYPERPVNRLTPDVKNIHVKDFIVESANWFIAANGIPEIPFNNILIENAEVKTKQLVRSLNDVKDFTVRNVQLSAEKDTIKILDGQNLLFQNVQISVPSNRIHVLMEGKRCNNIRFEDITNKDGKNVKVVRKKVK
jgi:polygalacturonase